MSPCTKSLVLFILFAASCASSAQVRTLNGCRLKPRTVCQNVNLSGRKLIRINLKGADLSGADLSFADLRFANLRGAKLVSARLTGARLQNADLTGAILTRALLNQANLKSARLSNGKLAHAQLHGTNLRKANLIGADLYAAELTGADLGNANLTRADLTAADLTGTFNIGTKFTGAIYDTVDPGQSPGNGPAAATPVIAKLELAQTHVLPPQGKTWSQPALSDYNLHLTGARAALALVDITLRSGQIGVPVLEAYADSRLLGEVVLNPAATLPPTESQGPAYSGTAYWAELDKTWVKPGLALAVRVQTGKRSALQPVKVGAPAVFTTYTLPFYLFGLSSDDIPLVQTAAPDVATRAEYFAKHPFAELAMVNHPAGKVEWPYIVVGPRQGRAAQRVQYQEQQGDGYAVMSAVLNTLSALRGANGDEPLNNHYYAPLLLAKQDGSYADPGGGLGGGSVGTGDYSYRGVFIHEQGHAFGMPHADAGYQSGDYPYVGGSLLGSNWGYDQIHNRFLGVFVPSSASRYASCATTSFPRGRQFDGSGRCIKQDPMQSGSGDQNATDRYTMFSDFNAGVVQHWLEGTTSISNGAHVYTGGRLFLDPDSPTGYSRWDSIDATWVPEFNTTASYGLNDLDKGLPLTRNVPVYAIIMTAGIAGITESSDAAHLDYNDTVSYDPTVTQIYPPLSFTGNLRRLIDANDPAQLASIIPNTSVNAWYCRNSGCDYTLRATYLDDSVRLVVLQKGFRKWFGSDFDNGSADPLNSNSFHYWAVNLPADRPLKKLELLETPNVYNGLPPSPRIIASRDLN